MTRRYKHIIIGVLCAVIGLLSGRYGWLNQAVIVTVLFFLVNYFFSSKNIKLFIKITGPFLIFFLGITTFNFIKYDETHVLPISILAFLGGFFGFYFRKHDLRIEKVILISTFLGFFSFLFMSNYLFLNFNNKKFEPIALNKLRILDKDESSLSLPDSKILVFDLWSLRCPECVATFPLFDKLENRFSTNNDISFLRINLPLKNQSKSDLEETINKYNLVTGIAIGMDTWDVFKVNTVPRIIVLNSSGHVYYNGLLNDKWYIFFDNIESEIINALKS